MRKINYLRISVTDRCNLRCFYCMPESGVKFMPHHDILSFEEIIKVVKVLSKEGIDTLRITGGEPLVRKGIINLIKDLKKVEGIKNISITTNGILLSDYAQELYNLGLKSINVSLDTLDPEQYRFITKRGDIKDVLKGIDALLKLSFKNIKINVVVMKNVNTDQIIPLAQMSVDLPLSVRFIEYMPINGDRDKFFSANDIKSILKSKYDIKKEEINIGSGPAYYCKIRGSKGHIGFITAMSNHFCSSCNRVRLTSDGKLRPCLLSNIEVDIKNVLRSSAENKDELLKNIFYESLKLKPIHHKLVDENIEGRRMYGIGG